LTVSLISNILTVSSPAGTYIVNFTDFRLAHVTAGSTEEYTCEGGEVNVKIIPEFPSTVTPLIFIILLTIMPVLIRRASKRDFVEGVDAHNAKPKI